MSKGMAKILKQAKKMQEELARIQEELETKTVQASSGGGMVTVTANGAGEVVSIKIEKEVVDPEDIDMLESLILAAVNEALRKAKEMIAEEMSKITGGFPLPGLM